VRYSGTPVTDERSHDVVTGIAFADPAAGERPE
jgi:hypothetical protein